MANITDTIYEIRRLDEISRQDTIIHNLNPLTKLLVSLVFIIITVSFPKYEVTGLIPLILYPVLIFNLGDIPVVPILKRAVLVLPLVLGIGLFNPILDRQAATSILGLTVTGGWLSYISLIIKCMFTVICALSLISTTGIDGIAYALRKLRVPKIFVLQILLTYRYISVLIEEAGNIWTAYSLRAPGEKGVNFRVWGSLLGQLLLRTYDRGERVYQSMTLRGFNGEYPNNSSKKIKSNDFIFAVFWICFLIICRIINIPDFLGSLMIGA